MNAHGQADIASGNQIDLVAMVARLWRARWWIVLSAISTGVLFVAVAIYSTPVYRASTVMVSAGGNNEMGGLSSALGQLGGLVSLAGATIGGADARTQEALAVLHSREFNEAFIRDNGMLFEFFASQWDAQRKSWKGAQKNWPTLASGVKYFERKVCTVTRDKMTGLVTMTIDWKDPVLAATWANALVARLNAEMRARAIERTSAAVGYLEKELSTTSIVETRQAINRLMEAQINQRMLANVTLEYAFRVVDRALVPERSDIIWPKKIMLAISGPIVGGVLGCLLVLVGGAFRKLREPAA